MKSPPSILVVDDEPANRDILQTRLSANGYDILTARDGEEALAVARSSEPDLILLDVHMPKMDGFEVCRRLKSDDGFPFTPIVMVTARVVLDNLKAAITRADRYEPIFTRTFGEYADHRGFVIDAAVPRQTPTAS